MTRSFILLSVVLALLVSACSQAPQDAQAPVKPQFGTSDYDYAVDVTVQKSLGHIYTTGNFGDRVFLRQYTRSGTLNWQRRSASRADQIGHALATDVDGSGNVYVAYAHFDKYDGFPENPTDGPFISKLNKNGSLLRRKPFPNLLEMDVDGSGNIYVSGDNSVRKYSTSGALLWSRRPSDNYENLFYGLEVAPDGDVIAIGVEGTLVKYNSDGKLLFREDRGYFPYGARLALGPQEEIFLTYWRNELDDYYRSLNIMKVSNQGKFLWKDSIVTSTSNAFANPRTDVDSQGNAYLTGNYVCDETNDDSECSDNKDDAFVRKYSPDGNVLWNRLFGTFKSDIGAALGLGSDRELYVTGYTEGKLTKDYAGNSDAFLRKLETSTGNRI